MRMENRHIVAPPNHITIHLRVEPPHPLLAAMQRIAQSLPCKAATIGRAARNG